MPKLAFATSSTSGTLIPNAAEALEGPLSRLSGFYAEIIRATGANTRSEAMKALSGERAERITAEEEAAALDLDLTTQNHAERLKSMAWKKALDTQGVGGR